MPLGNSAKTNLFLLLTNNVDWANVGDAGGVRGSVAAGSWYVGLHTASPGAAGTQLTSEATYGAYARVGVSRSGSTGWTVSGTAPTQFANTATVTFPQSTGTTNTLTDATLGRASSGAGEIFYYGTIGTPAGGLIINTGIYPYASAGQLIFQIT